MTAAHIRNTTSGFKFFLHPSQRRNPQRGQVRSIPWPKETSCAYEKIWMMFAPEHAAAIAKVTFNALDCLVHCLHNEKTTPHKKWTVLVRESNRLFRREAVLACSGIVVDVTAGSLIEKPLSDVAFVCIGFLGKLSGCGGAGFGHCPV